MVDPNTVGTVPMSSTHGLTTPTSSIPAPSISTAISTTQTSITSQSSPVTGHRKPEGKNTASFDYLVTLLSPQYPNYTRYMYMRMAGLFLHVHVYINLCIHVRCITHMYVWKSCHILCTGTNTHVQYTHVQYTHVQYTHACTVLNCTIIIIV